MATTNQHSAKEAVQQGKDMAKSMKEDLRDSAQKSLDQASGAMPELTERIWGAVSDIKSSLGRSYDSGKAYADKGGDLIKRYPYTAILGAVAVGALISGFFRSSKYD